MNCRLCTSLEGLGSMQLLEPSATCIESCDASAYAFMAPEQSGSSLVSYKSLARDTIAGAQ